MLSSYPVVCPHANCGWTGNLLPSLLRGGADAEIVSMHCAWFRCPRCQGDWEVRIAGRIRDPLTQHAGLLTVSRGVLFWRLLHALLEQGLELGACLLGFAL